MIRKYLLLLAFSAFSAQSFAQKSYNEQVLGYIAQFKDLAILEQQRTGIPAAITLAQGIFETGAGSSELCTNASNHFGIKCKSSWTGETYAYTDDARNECFRKYTSATHSYTDHSDFLKNNRRYSRLFSISPTDYAAWAYGLKRCGYATNPQYAKKLIKTIEDFNLQEYTYAALGSNPEEVILASAREIPLPRTNAAVIPGEHVPDEDGYTTATTQQVKHSDPDNDNSDDDLYVDKAAAQEVQAKGNVTAYYQTTRKHKMKGFYARKGDMLLEYAIKNRIRYAKLLELNDLPDAPLEADMFIYLERKPKTAQAATHTVENGESLLQISQAEGLQLQQLRLLNHLEKGEEPVAGTVLNLQTVSGNKPELYAARSASETRKTYTPRLSNDNGFVPAGKESNTTTVDLTESSEEKVQESVPEGRRSFPARKVNIADEKPVEEVIAEERQQKQQQSRKATPAKEEKEMTALEKLKAHMDKTVYADRDFQPKASGNYESEEETPREEEAIATTPARKNAVSGNSNRSTGAKSGTKLHTVRRGETLFRIASKYNMTVSQLQKLNKLSGKSKIIPGMKLKVAQ